MSFDDDTEDEENSRVNVPALVKQWKSGIGSETGTTLKELLGSGNYGQVYHACILNNCQWAAKIAYVRDKEEWKTALLDAEYTDLLQDLTIAQSALSDFSASSAAPTRTSRASASASASASAIPVIAKMALVSSLILTKRDTRLVQCNNSRKRYQYNGFVVTVLELFEGNMTALSEKRVQQVPSRFPHYRRDTTIVSVFYEQELQDMFAIAYAMGHRGFVHGDLKPDQYLMIHPNFQRRPWDVSQRIVIADFGFSGFVTSLRPKNDKTVPWMGWTGPDDPESMPWKTSPRGKMKELKTKHDAVLFNLWQLCMWFYYNPKGHALVVLKDGKTLMPFAGIKGLSKEMAASRGGFRRYINASIQAVVNKNESSDPSTHYFLDWNAIHKQALE